MEFQYPESCIAAVTIKKTQLSLVDNQRREKFWMGLGLRVLLCKLQPRQTLQNKRYDILDGLPTYGPMYVPISEDGIPFYSEGYVVRFYKSDGTSWVANFKTGWTNFSGIYDFPEFKRTVVYAFGKCYIMTDDEQNPLKAFGVGFTNVYQTDDNILIAPDQMDITVIEISTDEVWHSERISWDGFDGLNFNGDFVTGLAFEPTSGDGEWRPFSFNYRTKEIIGGTYQFHNQRKPWWKIW